MYKDKSIMVILNIKKALKKISLGLKYLSEKNYLTLKVTLLANLLASSESFWIEVSAP